MWMKTGRNASERVFKRVHKRADTGRKTLPGILRSLIHSTPISIDANPHHNATGY